jgi:hypothetical protein
MGIHINCLPFMHFNGNKILTTEIAKCNITFIHNINFYITWVMMLAWLIFCFMLLSTPPSCNSIIFLEQNLNLENLLKLKYLFFPSYFVSHFQHSWNHVPLKCMHHLKHSMGMHSNSLMLNQIFLFIYLFCCINQTMVNSKLSFDWQFSQFINIHPCQNFKFLLNFVKSLIQLSSCLWGY